MRIRNHTTFKSGHGKGESKDSLYDPRLYGFTIDQETSR